MAKTLNRQSGWGLVELFLSIIGGMIMISGGIMAYRQIQFSQSLYETSALVSTLATGVINLRGPIGDFEGVDTAWVAERNLLPAPLEAEGSVLRHPLGGPLTLSSDAPYDSFWMTLQNVPGNACRRVFDLSRGELQLANDRLLGIAINGTYYVLDVMDPDVSTCVEEGNTIRLEFS